MNIFFYRNWIFFTSDEIFCFLYIFVFWNRNFPSSLLLYFSKLEHLCFSPIVLLHFSLSTWKHIGTYFFFLWRNLFEREHEQFSLDHYIFLIWAPTWAELWGWSRTIAPSKKFGSRKKILYAVLAVIRAQLGISTCLYMGFAPWTRESQKNSGRPKKQCPHVCSSSWVDRLTPPEQIFRHHLFTTVHATKESHGAWPRRPLFPAVRSDSRTA